MGHIPLQRLYHANVVVRDLNATARNYAQILGINRWQVCHWTPERLRRSQAFGYRAQFGYSTATGSNAQGVTFQLVQPTHGFSTFTEYLITRGEGIHSFCATALPASRLDTLVARLADKHVYVAQAASLENGTTTVLFDTRKMLGGFFVEVETTTNSESRADEEWDFSAEVERPDAVAWLTQIPKIGHFGIAVSQLTDKLPRYARVLGVERWTGVHFHMAPESLEHSTFEGQRVENAWLLAITDVADFGLELLQGTRVPTDYHQTVQRIGEGIHHVLIRRGIAEQEWWALRAWMESMQIGVVMSGRLRSAEFFYLDTRAALGGYLLEVIVTREPPSGIPSGTGLVGRFDLDFTTLASS
jgi:hypothetical protein